MSDVPDATHPPSRKMRMPRGLPYIVVNEAAERYSFYGMRSILTVFMTKYLLDSSGQADPMTESEAKIWYHTFIMGVYFLPIIGALLADIFLGKYKTIMALSLVYCLGHLVLALDHTRLGLSGGLALIAIGAGGIKPCVSAHLGDQFSRGNSHLLDKAYAWFYFSINVGAVISTLAGEWLLRDFGPHVAFGVPGGLMLLATAVFYYGRTEYRSIAPSGWPVFKQTLFAGETRRAILRLLPVFALVAVFWSLYDQTGSSWVLQAQSDLMDKRVRLFGWSVTLLPSQIQAVNAALILLFVPLFSAVLYPMSARYGIASTALRKIGLGMFLAALSFAIIATLELRIFNGQSASVSGQLWAYVAMTAAEVLISMTCLEFAYTQAPNPAKSLVMGLYFLSLSAGNFLAVEVNRFIRADFPIAAVVAAVATDTGQGLPQPAANADANFAPLRLRSVRSISESDKAPDLINGRKIMFSGDCGLERLVPAKDGEPADTVRLQGTFLLAAINPGAQSFGLLDAATRQPLLLRGTYSPGPDHAVHTDRLVGAEYFWFFCGLMGLAALVFVPVAKRYSGERYLQDEATSKH